MPTDMCGQTRPWTPEEDQQHQIPQVKITISPLSVRRAYNIEYKSPCPYESYQMAARLASTKITHGKSSKLFSGDRDMHGHLEISGPNHPKGGVQYRNQGPIRTLPYQSVPGRPFRLNETIGFRTFPYFSVFSRTRPGPWFWVFG